MEFATLSTLCTEPRPSEPRAEEPALPLSVTLLDGARACVELAGGCIRRGTDPRLHLRWAMTRIRKLPAALAPPGDTEILAILALYAEGIFKREDVAREIGWPVNKVKVVKKRMARRLEALGITPDSEPGLPLWAQ